MSVAVVTGGAGGLGRAISRRLAASGRHVLLVDRAPEVELVADELRRDGFAASTQIGSLDDSSAPAQVAEAILRIGSPLEVLVNNAGITADARLAEMDDDAFRRVVDVNLAAAMRLTLDLDREVGFGASASIVNISSRAGLGNFGQVNYVASKAGLVGFTRALALGWAGRVRVNAVAPGLIETPMTAAMPDRVREKLVAKIPLARIGTPGDVADTVAFLVSADARYVTGQVVLCCGGRSLV